MTNIIFSIYIENNEDNLSDKHLFTRNQLKKHYDRLVEVKKTMPINVVQNLLYMKTTHITKGLEKYDGLEFDVINLYKIHILERLSKEYDNVLYLDLDVIPNTSENFFEVFDMNKLCVYAPYADMESWSQKDKKNYKKGKVSFETIVSHKDKYSEYVKAMCKRAMLALDNKLETNYFIANTAILGGNSSAINKLRYSDRLKDMMNNLNLAKQEKLFGEEISKLFFANNEVFFHYLLDKYNIDWFNLPKEWHTYYMKNHEIKNVHNAKMIHLINKKFEELWSLLDGH